MSNQSSVTGKLSRRGFLRLLGIGAAGAVAAPVMMAGAENDVLEIDAAADRLYDAAQNYISHHNDAVMYMSHPNRRCVAIPSHTHSLPSHTHDFRRCNCENPYIPKALIQEIEETLYG